MRILIQSSNYPGQMGPLDQKAEKLRGEGHEVELVRIRVRRARPGRSMGWRLPQYAWNGVQALGVALRPGRYGRVIVDNSPPLIGVPLTLRTRLLGEELVLMHFDIFPENAEIAGILERGPLLGALKRLAHGLARQADVHVTLSERMAGTLRGFLGEDTPVTVELFPPETRLQPVEHAHNGWREEQGLNDRFVVMYSGNLGAMYDFTPVLEAARELADRPEIVFVFVGTGYREPEIRHAAAASGNVRLLPPQPEHRLAEVLSAADAHVVPLRPGADRAMWPSKINALEPIGRPILAVGWETGRRSVTNVASGGLVEELLRLRSSSADYTHERAQLFDGLTLDEYREAVGRQRADERP